MNVPGVREERVANVVEKAADRFSANTQAKNLTRLEDLTLQVVLQFTGKNEGIFVANVCKRWSSSYKSTFGRICTHRAAGMMSLSRVRWVWSEWPHWHALPTRMLPVRVHVVMSDPRKPFASDEPGRKDPSWYLGKYAPRSVVEAVILDESLTVRSEYLMRGIAGSGRIRLFEELWKDHITTPAEARDLEDRVVISKFGVEASKYGHVQILALIFYRLAEDLRPSCGILAVELAACRGHVQVLEFLSLTEWWSYGEVPTNIGALAAAHNQIEVLRWLPAHGFEWDEQVALAAAAFGEVGTIDFLFENGCPFIGERFVACCVQQERLDALQWCYDILRLRVPHVWTEANLQKWLLLAGTYDSICIAEFLRAHGAVWPDIGQRFGTLIDSYNISSKCEFQKVIVRCIWSVTFLAWAIAGGCTLGTWTSTTCARLIKETDWDDADRPHLEVLAWAHSHDSPCICQRHVPDF